MKSEGFEIPLATCASELKTPLILLRQLALELEVANDPVRQKEIARRMRLATERSLRLTDNLSKLASLDGAMFECEPVNLGGICLEVVAELSPLSQAMAQEFEIKNSKTMVATAHRELLYGVVMGLVDNALGASGSKIKISLRQKKGALEISVRDFGPIVDLAEMRQLQKNLAWQKKPISARPSNGNLGLVIADKFARAMGGELKFSRHHSGGATFSVRLPLSQQLRLEGV